MHLSKLRISGFKSYTEPVQFDFGPTIAVIIGNNGTGKSNCLEAILWALGEDDPARLRLRGVEDAFFAGTDDTPPAQEVRVEATLTGDEKDIELARFLDSRGNQSFLVDGQTLSSREQYLAALAGLGLGGACMSVIRQEEISDIFTMTPDDLGRFLDQGQGRDGRELERAFAANLEILLPGSVGRLLRDGSGGAEVEVNFPDKGPKKGHLLSGGERAVTALALKLAVFDQHGGPFFLLDEVEPSLDWVRNHNTQKLLKSVCQDRQLVMVTHLRSTINIAETVHGVRLRPDGSSWLKFHFVMDERLYRLYKCC